MEIRQEMDFENDNIDPYEILGVPFGASIEVCKATYKSLSKIYHPDVFVGEKSYAATRCKMRSSGPKGEGISNVAL